MNIAVLGSGIVGQTLAAGFLAHGHTVSLGTRDTAKLAAWHAGNNGVTLTSPQRACAPAEAVVLAVKGTAASAALKGAGDLAGKIIIDATNPIADAPPDNGVLRFFTTHDQSLIEKLQAEFPAARFVKAFSCVGAALMVNPTLAGGPPTMFICGNDAAAKQAVTTLLTQLGWETADMGAVQAGRAIEPLCILWCIPGFQKNQWTHAFKLLT